MKSHIRRTLIASLSSLHFVSAEAVTPLREATLRQAAIDGGFAPAEQVMPEYSQALSNVGELLFESKELSLNRETSCQTCHLDRFSSADGIPNAVGTGGHGEGIERLRGGGDIVPRNTLPLWGRGSVGFNVLFWDGKVDGSGEKLLSQFGDSPPSQDPLVTAVHLPIVELREMVTDDKWNRPLVTESLSSAEEIYDVVVQRLREEEELGIKLSNAFEIDRKLLNIKHVAEAISAFIRDRFRIKKTRFHQFVFDDGILNKKEIAGGLVFYGKGGCISCHSGPFFSDLKFHAIPFGQAGFGRNGFGVDYGRFNVTLDPRDLNYFRTPPLFNVSKTAPYSHSGHEYDLKKAIISHVDPLSDFDPNEMTREKRIEYYRKLKIWAVSDFNGVNLNEDEINNLVEFLDTLSFD